MRVDQATLRNSVFWGRFREVLNLTSQATAHEYGEANLSPRENCGCSNTRRFSSAPIMDDPTSFPPLGAEHIPTTPERTPRGTPIPIPEETAPSQALLGTRPPPNVPLGARSVGSTLESWTIMGSPRAQSTAAGAPSEVGYPELPPQQSENIPHAMS